MTAPEGWFVISDSQLRDALQRAQAGEEPDLVLTELYANSEIERHEP
jgi:hypothetical protein